MKNIYRTCCGAIAMAGGVLFAEVDGKTLFLVLNGGYSVAGAGSYAGSAMQAYVTRVKNRIGFKLAVGEYKSEATARAKLFRKKDF